jgi:putative phosphoribosyl transferase
VQVRVPAGVIIDGDLTVPEQSVGVVVFAHGSGSSRFSPRNRKVASALNERGIATLLLDLLTPEEERVDDVTRRLRFDVEMLAERLVAARSHVADSTGLPVGYFGASTGAASALLAAAAEPTHVSAIVSRGGRPDLAGAQLSSVRAPTLLICGGRDPVVIDVNRQALRRLAQAPVQLEIVPGATHLFEEPGALDEVARLAADWFGTHFAVTR